MNYAGHEKLRADVAEVANTMCDLRARLNDMEHRCRFDSDVLVERLTPDAVSRQSPVHGGVYRNSGTGFLLQRLRRRRECTEHAKRCAGSWQ
ncbi:hypothetical protein LNKOIFOO_003881 [Escherichia coli]|nr:hypothetical protein [Escherichia coli]